MFFTEFLIFELILAVIVVEAITNIITKSELFFPIRRFFFNRKEKSFYSAISDLLECGYCMSVWVGWFVALMYWQNLLFNPFFIGLVLHRLANLLHHVIDRIWGNNI